jgi:hypothetical protein
MPMLARTRFVSSRVPMILRIGISALTGRSHRDLIRSEWETADHFAGWKRPFSQQRWQGDDLVGLRELGIFR